MSDPVAVEPTLLATIAQRAVALVIDNLLTALVVLPFIWSALEDVLKDPQGTPVPLYATALVAGVSGLYNWLMIAWRGQTLGKMVMRIRVVTVDGGRVGFSHAGIRALVPTAVQLVPYGVGGLLMVLVYGWALIDADRQGLHDKAAGTLVVQRLAATR